MNEIISKFEAKGFNRKTPLFGDKVKIATLIGEYEDYNGLCQVQISTNIDGIVDCIIVEGEEYLSVDNVLDDFDFFCSKAEEYKKYGFKFYDEINDVFDEDDIDSVRNGSLEKSVRFKRNSDNSVIRVSINADEEDDVYYVQMALFNGVNIDDYKEFMSVLENQQKQSREKLAQARNSHLLFSGVEMDGAIEDFVEELETKGFRIEMEPKWIDEYKMARMRGPFMGEPCKLLLTSNEIGDIMQVWVSKKERKSFDIVKDEFYKLLDAYSEKYGTPDYLDESLTKMSNPISALQKNCNGNLQASFLVGVNGSSISIFVTLEEDSWYPHITIGYLDGLNKGINQDDNGIEDTDIDVDDINNDDYYYDDI